MNYYFAVITYQIDYCLQSCYQGILSYAATLQSGEEVLYGSGRALYSVKCVSRA